MRKLSFLSLSVIAILSLSGCSKEDLPRNSTSVYEENHNQNYFPTSYSQWTADASLTWADLGTTSEPGRESNWSAPELTQEMIDAGFVVLIYAKSNIDGTVHAMPWDDVDVSNDKVNSYYASPAAGSILVTHSRSINGVYEVPDNSNDVSFRYIVVGPHTPDVNAREITVEQLSSMAYENVIELLGIPR